MAFDAFALILAMLALGLLFRRLRVFPDNAAEVLNKVVLYVCLPASVLIYAPRLELGTHVLAIAAVPWLLLAATVLLVSLATRVLKLRPDEHAVLLLCVALGNTSFLGYPLVRALLGEAALPYAVIYDQFGAFLILSTVGLLALAHYSGERRPTPREMALRVARFPPVWALAFGLTLMPEHPPAWIASALEALAGVLLMLVMLAVGLTIQLRLPRDEIAPLATGLVLKLGVLPLLALPLGMASKRGRRTPGVVFASLALLLLNHTLQFGKSLAESGRLPAALAVWTPFLLFALLSLWIFRGSLAWPGDNPVSRTVGVLERLIERLKPRRLSNVAKAAP